MLTAASNWLKSCVTECPTTLLVVEILGGLFILCKILSVFGWVYSNFLRPASSLKKYVGNNKWAVVTGASDGIGAGFCTQLAKKGANIVLISRTQSKLETLAADLESKYKIQTKVIAVDFSAANDQTFENIRSQLEGLDVSILVNNVGVNNEMVTPFLDNPTSELNSMINVNVYTTTKMTKLVAGIMKAQNRGLIINLGSFTGLFPTPMVAVYAGTKAFVHAFSESLHYELKPFGIEVLAITPYYVASSMTGMSRAGGLICTAERLAKDTLTKIGSAVILQPYWRHSLVGAIANALPRGLLMRQMFSQMKVVRAKQLRKKAKAAERKSE